MAEGSPIARIGDIAVGCHTAVIVSGVGNVLVEGSPVATIGDVAVGCPTGTIVSGAGTVLA